MQLTSTDETDLLLPLYAGVHDEGAWRTFLTRVQRRTGADHASMIFAQGDTPMHLAKEVFAGRNLRMEARFLGLDPHAEKNRMPYDILRPGRVYQATEFTQVDSQFRKFREMFEEMLGLSDERVLRIKEQEGTSAWLTLARNDDVFSAADGALLTALAPHVAAALRSFVLTERQRISASASRDGLARAGVGWIVFGRDGRIIDFAPALTAILRQLNGTDAVAGEKLHITSPLGRQIMAQTAAIFAQNPAAMPRPLILSEEPRIDALLVPITDGPEAALALPIMVAYCRIHRTPACDRRNMLGDLFGLTLREAELALAMSEGKSISEAALAMGWTNETARSYSKQVYAKMGVNGHAALVRKVFMSSANLA